MNFASVEKIAAAVLYEGYILYPYRATAIKNRQRWNFGTLYPVFTLKRSAPRNPSASSPNVSSSPATTPRCTSKSVSSNSCPSRE